MVPPRSPSARVRRGWLVLALVVAAALVAGACTSTSTTTSSSSTSSSTSAPAAGTTGTPVTAPLGSVPCTPATAQQKTTVAYRTIDGVDPDAVSLDVHPVAGACGAPVVMWVHGGGYRVGDKTNQTRDKVRLFNGHGWILVSVNYRLTKPGEAGSAEFPDHFDDVATAVAWVHDNIAGYGGDPSRIALLGHSAGADIVSNVAVNPTYLGDHDLDLSVLSCAGPLDTEGFDKRAGGSDDPDGEQAQWQAALGNNPNYLEETSASMLVVPNIGIPPMIGVVRGTERRQQIESGFLDTLRAAGIEATTIDARSLSHEDVHKRIGEAGDTVMTEPLVAFLTTCFRER